MIGLETDLQTSNCKEVNGLGNEFVGPLEGAADVAMAKELAAFNMIYAASDFNWKESDKYLQAYNKTHSSSDRKNFEEARLDEREAAKHIAAVMQYGPVVITRGAAHFLWDTPTTLRSQFQQYGKTILTFDFDYTGHDVADELATIRKDGGQFDPPDYVIDLHADNIYRYPGTVVGVSPAPHRATAAPPC